VLRLKRREAKSHYRLGKIGRLGKSLDVFGDVHASVRRAPTKQANQVEVPGENYVGGATRRQANRCAPDAQPETIDQQYLLGGRNGDVKNSHVHNGTLIERVGPESQDSFVAVTGVRNCVGRMTHRGSPLKHRKAAHASGVEEGIGFADAASGLQGGKVADVG